MAKATSVIDVILGEAAGAKQKASPEERYADMLGIASVVGNRSTRTNTPADDVVAAKDKYGNPQFDAYGNKLPSGVEAYRGLAEQAWNHVQTVGPVHNGVFYAAPGANLGIKGLVTVDQTKGHVFYDDPENRNILVGDNRYAKPSEERFAVPQTQVANVPGLNVPAVPANAYAPDLTNPAHYAFADILSPSPVQTTSIAPPDVALPSIAPTPTLAPEAPSTRSTGGLGLAALAPNGLVGQTEANINYAHPERGEWSTGMQTPTIEGALMMAGLADQDMTIQSGYRSPSINASVRGAPNSYHMQGLAFDLNLAGLTDRQKADTVENARTSGATRISTYPNPNLLHVDYADGWQGKMANPVNAEGTYAMHNRSQFNMDDAPGWFTQGLTQQTNPTPTSRDDALASVLADQAATTQAYQEMAQGLGAAGIPNIGGTSSTFAAPVGDVERASLPDIPSVPEAVLNDYAQTVAPAGFDFSVPTTPTQVASLAPAPVDSVERSSLPSLAPAPAVPSTTDMANAYGQLASTMTQAGVTGLGAMPSTPSVPSATTFASLPNTLTAPANTFQSTTPAPVATSVPTVPSTPAPAAIAAPAVPTPAAAPAAPKSESPSLGSRLGHAAIGGAIGGLPGAVIGGLFGPAITSTTKDVLGGIGKGLGLNTNATPSTSSKSTGTGLGGFLGGLGDVFSGQSNITMPESTYSVGKGVDAIGGVFSGAFGPGATAISLGNPNVSFTDLGNGNVAKVNSELGTTSLVNASSFNWSGGTQGNGKSSSASSWGLGDVFGGLGDAVSDAFSGWGGDASTSSSYSGPNSTTDPSDSW